MSSSDSYEEIVHKIDELRKGKDKFEKYVACLYKPSRNVCRAGKKPRPQTLVRDSQGLKLQIIRRAIAPWKRSPETLGEEIVALNDVDEALRNNCVVRGCALFYTAVTLGSYG